MNIIPSNKPNNSDRGHGTIATIIGIPVKDSNWNNTIIGLMSHYDVLIRYK